MRTLVTGALSLTSDLRERLNRMGLVVTDHPDERAPVKDPEQYEVVICNALFLYQPIEQFTALKLIHLTSAGFDRVPVEYIRSHGILLRSAGGVYSAPMAEFALGGVLQLYKQARFFGENQRRRVWEKHRGLLELSGKRVCIVGAGSVGSELAKRFTAFDAQVTGIDLYPRDTQYFDAVLGLEKLNELLGTSDIIVLTLPLSDATWHLFDAARLRKIKPGAILVNIARGAIVDEAALIDALQTGRLSGAVLDVFEEEPLSVQSPLWEMKNVILTPHNSFVSVDVQKRLSCFILSNIQEVLRNV